MSSRSEAREPARRPVRSRVLVVDDEPPIRTIIERALAGAGFDCVGAGDLAEAREALVDRPFDLLLCDIQLGAESGLDLVREVCRELPETGVVMVTGIDDRAVADEALVLGALGYLVKPFTPNELLIQVDGGLRRRELERARRFHVEELEAKILDRSAALHRAFGRIEEAQREMGSAHRETADRLTLALTLRDEETGRHVERVGRYVVLLADRAGIRDWSEDDLHMAGMLHDVGKIAVPDMVLLKPGILTEEEWALIRRHAEAGHRLLEGASTVALRLGASIAMTHHERWDGMGYPCGLAGEAIPVEGRLTAIADCFDALTSRRVYRAALDVRDALDVMEGDRGHFDPVLHACFVAHIEDFLAVRAELPDPEPPVRPVNVVVVDDHAMFTESLVRLLARDDGCLVSGTAGSVREGIALCRSAEPDVVVADWNLPDGTGADLAVAVRAERPSTQVVILTGAAEESVLLAALDAGCAGCLGKHRAFQELMGAVRAAHAGDPLVPPDQLHSLLLRLRPRPSGGIGEPTSREREILALMADGLSTEAIAGRLSLSLHTVRNHIQRVLAKLGAHSRLEAVATAVRSGLLTRT